MNKGNNNRRSRGRGGNKRHGNVRNQSFESNGPGVKVRGTAQQVLDKYLALARDASSSGDRIAAESYFQFAEHYFRLLNTEENRNADRNQQGRGRGNGRDRSDTPGGAEGGPEDQQNQDRDQAAAGQETGEVETIPVTTGSDAASDPKASDKNPDDGSKKDAEEPSDEAAVQELPGFITQPVEEVATADETPPKRAGRGRRKKVAEPVEKAVDAPVADAVEDAADQKPAETDAAD